MPVWDGRPEQEPSERSPVKVVKAAVVPAGSTVSRVLLPKSLPAYGMTAMLAFAPGAGAVTFDITAAQFTPGPGYGVDPNENSNVATEIDVRFSTSSFSAQNFSLNAVNQSFTFGFGTIDLEEPNAHGGIVANETDGLGITGTLTFSAPSGVTRTVTALGVATPGSISDSSADYVIDWLPVTVLFGNGGSFLLNLTDMSFLGRGSQVQNATITLLSLVDPINVAEPVNVPEPGTLALLGLGLAGLGLSRRRKAH